LDWLCGIPEGIDFQSFSNGLVSCHLSLAPRIQVAKWNNLALRYRLSSIAVACKPDLSYDMRMNQKAQLPFTPAVFFIATMIKLKQSVNSLTRTPGKSKPVLLTGSKAFSPLLGLFFRDGAFFYLV
jgi:hypothetical protein